MARVIGYLGVLCLVLGGVSRGHLPPGPQLDPPREQDALGLEGNPPGLKDGRAWESLLEDEGGDSQDKAEGPDHDNLQDPGNPNLASNRSIASSASASIVLMVINLVLNLVVIGMLAWLVWQVARNQQAQVTQPAQVLTMDRYTSSYGYTTTEVLPSISSTTGVVAVASMASGSVE